MLQEMLGSRQTFRIFTLVILMETVLENTVPRAIRRPSQQAWLLFGVMGPFCFILCTAGLLDVY